MNPTINWDKYENNAETYSILSNPKRLAIINTIGIKEMSVEELGKKLGISPTNLSQHLAYMRHVRLVKVRRQGTRMFYSLVYPKVTQACSILYDFHKKRQSARA